MRPSLESLFKHSLLVLCLLGFGWITWGQVSKFVSGKTAVSVSLADAVEVNVPDMAFCLKQPFDEGATSTYVTREEYDRHSPVVNVSVAGVFFNEFHGTVAVAHSVQSVYTVYNGRCAIVHIIDKIPSRHYLTLTVSDRRPLNVFLLEPGEDLLLVWQAWAASAFTTFSLETDTLVSLDLNEYNFVSSKVRPCEHIQETANANAFFSCVSLELDGGLRKSGVDCTAVHLAKFVSLPECNRSNETTPYDLGNNTSSTRKRSESTSSRRGDESEALDSAASDVAKHDDDVTRGRIRRAMEASLDILANLTNLSVTTGVPSPCRQSCLRRQYVVRSTALTFLKGDPFHVSSGWGFYVTFPGTVKTVSEEFFVYDLNAIVSAVGGGLGMFLGVSAFGAFAQVVQWSIGKRRAEDADEDAENNEGEKKEGKNCEEDCHRDSRDSRLSGGQMQASFVTVIC